MKAMILAAGLGTRLRPLTDTRPKALVEVADRTMLEITLGRLWEFGVRQVIVNVHHFADMIVEYLKANNNFDMEIAISREEVLLDTGGGLKNAAWFFREGCGHSRSAEPFILHNVDVISSIDLRRMAQFHVERKALATLAVQERWSSRQLLFNQQLQLCGRKTAHDGKEEVAQAPERLPGSSAATAVAVDGMSQALAFSGIHMISPRLLEMIDEGVFSIIDSYLHLASRGEKILGFRADEYYWRDLGTPESLLQAAQDIEKKIFP